MADRKSTASDESSGAGSVALYVVVGVLALLALVALTGIVYGLRRHDASTPRVASPPPPPVAATAIASNVPDLDAATPRPIASARRGVTGTPVTIDAERTIMTLRPRFKRCYQKGLATDPEMSGKLIMAIDLAPNGDVSSVSKAGGSGLSTTVEDCLMTTVRRASFDAPGGGGATLEVPVTFVKQ